MFTFGSADGGNRAAAKNIEFSSDVIGVSGSPLYSLRFSPSRAYATMPDWPKLIA